MKKEIDYSKIVNKIWHNAASHILPTDKEVSKWFDENGISEASSSSAIYKFRLWLNDRSK